MGNICVFTAVFQTDYMKYIYKHQSKLLSCKRNLSDVECSPFLVLSEKDKFS